VEDHPNVEADAMQRIMSVGRKILLALVILAGIAVAVYIVLMAIIAFGFAMSDDAGGSHIASLATVALQ